MAKHFINKKKVKLDVLKYLNNFINAPHTKINMKLPLQVTTHEMDPNNIKYTSIWALSRYIYIFLQGGSGIHAASHRECLSLL